jgi:hypothetical protein
MKPEIDDTLLTAYALGELDAQERDRVAAHVEANPEARLHVEAMRETALAVRNDLIAEPVDGLTEIHREVIERRLQESARSARRRAAAASLRWRRWLPLAGSIAASIAIVAAVLAFLLPRIAPQGNVARTPANESSEQGLTVLPPENSNISPRLPEGEDVLAHADSIPGEVDSPEFDDDSEWEPVEGMLEPDVTPAKVATKSPAPAPAKTPETKTPVPPSKVAIGPARSPEAEDVRNSEKKTSKPPTAKRKPKTVNVSPPRDPAALDKIKSAQVTTPKVYENPFRKSAQRPRSWFPVRVDTIAYWAVRNNLLEKRLPKPERVRIEELINRYAYRYEQPAEDGAPLAVSVEIARCPWNVEHRLARIALKAREGGATVVAKNVETSVEFNSANTAAWRLIGYENAPVPPNQSKSGIPMDLAAGNAATAFYEIVPAAGVEARASNPKQLFTVKVRYIDPSDDTRSTKELEQAATDIGNGFDRASEDFRFASAVAAFGMLLRDSHFKGTATYADVIRWATSGKGADESKQRAALIDLVRTARDLSR